MSRTIVDEEGDRPRIDVAWRRAVGETRVVLERAGAAWAGHGCPATAECCQLAVTGRQPWPWESEWRLLLAHLARERRELPAPRSDGACPFLDEAGARCTVYAARPFGCRTFFCHRRTGPGAEPSAATHALLDRLASLNVSVDSTAAPRALLDWVAAERERRETSLREAAPAPTRRP